MLSDTLNMHTNHVSLQVNMCRALDQHPSVLLLAPAVINTYLTYIITSVIWEQRGQNFSCGRYNFSTNFIIICVDEFRPSMCVRISSPKINSTLTTTLCRSAPAASYQVTCFYTIMVLQVDNLVRLTIFLWIPSVVLGMCLGLARWNLGWGLRLWTRPSCTPSSSVVLLVYYPRF